MAELECKKKGAERKTCVFFADNGRDTRCGVQSLWGGTLSDRSDKSDRSDRFGVPRWFSSQSGKAFTPETAESGLFADNTRDTRCGALSAGRAACTDRYG